MITKKLLQLGGERKTPETYLTSYLSIWTLFGNYLTVFSQNSISSMRAITKYRQLVNLKTVPCFFFTLFS